MPPAARLAIAVALLAEACTASVRPRAPAPSVVPAPSARPRLPAVAPRSVDAGADDAPPASLLARLRADFDARLADPRAYRALAEAETRRLPDGALFAYVLPALAYVSLARAGAMSVPEARDRLAVLIDPMLPLVAAHARAPAGDLARVSGRTDQATWLGECAMILGAWQLLQGDGRYEAVHARLSAVLLESLQAAQGAALSSYPGLRWTFDTTPVALALRLRAVVSGLPGADEAVRAHLAWTDAHLHPGTGLPWSRLEDRRDRPTAAPRGCDLALRIPLLALLDPARARRFHERFVAHFSRRAVGLVGFAEWPAGDEHEADADSGPIVLGMGLSATGFGIAAARAVGDEVLAGQLEHEVALLPAMLALLGPAVAAEVSRLGITIRVDRYITGMLVGDAALFWALAWHDWGVALP